MSFQPSDLQTLAGSGVALGFPWPADDESLRIAQGPVSAALVRALLGGARHSDPGSWRPSVVMTSQRDPTGDALAAPSPLTLDVALVALDLLQRGQGQAPLNPRVVLARKAYRRWGRERQAFEGRVAAQIGLLQRLKLLTEDGPEPLLALAPRNVARTDFIVRAAPALATELRRGDWTEAPIAVLRLDHRRNRGADVLAKRLATVIALAGVSGAFGVTDLLMRAGVFPHARLGRPHGMAERLLEALRRLRALGVFEIEGLEALERKMEARVEWLSAQIRIRRRPAGATAISARTDEQHPEAADIDIEGTPPRAPSRRGRPRFEPSAQQRNLVRTLAAGGATREQIARAVEVSLPTLRCYFAAELRTSERAFVDETWQETAVVRRAQGAG